VEENASDEDVNLNTLIAQITRPQMQKYFLTNKVKI
jgi:hypothetical protein